LILPNGLLAVWPFGCPVGFSIKCFSLSAAAEGEKRQQLGYFSTRSRSC